MIPEAAVEAACRAEFSDWDTNGDEWWRGMTRKRMHKALEAAAPHILAAEGLPSSVREFVRADLARVEGIRDRFEPGTPVWLTNNGMALAYESILALLEDSHPRG